MEREKMDWIIAETREWFAHRAGYKSEDDWKAVVGISGGKDSSVVAALLCKVMGADKVYGVLMPNGEQSDIQDSIDLVKQLGIHHMTVNIADATYGLLHRLDLATTWGAAGVPEGFKDDVRVTTNLPARLRMCVEYAIANHINARVIGTGNKSEDLVGWATLYGDTACDFQPLAELYVDEVIALGELLGLPERFTRKPPSDGMCGKTDEEALGFAYKDVEMVLLNTRREAIKTLGEEKVNRVWERLHAAAFKRHLVSSIPCPGRRRW